MKQLTVFIGLAVAILGAVAGPPPPPAPDALKERLLKVCADEEYAFSPAVRDAFLAYAKAETSVELDADGVAVPEDFRAWVDADPTVEATVYGIHRQPSKVLLWLYSLRLDLGLELLDRYRQLALATAIVSAKEELEPDLTPRQPLKLVMNSDPGKPVDTAAAGREPDVNDQIINFLNENTIEEEVVVGYREVPPELKYDERGVAIPAPKSRKPKKAPITETRTRTLYAADVLASAELQREFNAYMKARGCDVQIDCGDRIVHWNSHDMVRGERRKQINAAFVLFRTAYEAKGLLPAARDPFPSPAERCAYLIRNDAYRFPPELQAQRKWPRFPLTAPWPILTMLAANNQPLREREERWLAFRDKGEFRTYGEYIGGVAQQFDMQSARRLKPYPFTYGTVQMMLKDGGVCGTMAAISSRSHNILGIPASQASQPGHCAMVAYRYDPKRQTYSCKGGQYATGGDDKTTPFTPWFFEDQVKRVRRTSGHEVSFRQRKPMVYHQSVAWAVNYGLQSYLDSTMAYAVSRLLPETQRATGGVKLLESGLSLNPYNFLLVDAAQAAAPTPLEQIRFWRVFQKTLTVAAGKPGCPADGLYPRTVKNHVFARIAALPVPENTHTAEDVLAFLEDEKCRNADALVAYRLALTGLPAVLSRTEQEFAEQLVAVQAKASRENDDACSLMAETIRSAANAIKDRKQRKEWAQELWETARGHEKYFGNRYRVATHPALPVLARLAGRKMPPDSELVGPLLTQVAEELRLSVAGARKLGDCRQLAAKIKATGACIKNPDRKRQWLQGLVAIIEGKEMFTLENAGKRRKTVRDPCAATINQLILPLQEALAAKPDAGGETKQ